MPIKLNHHVTTIVRSVKRETDRVLVYELADPDDWELPPFTPGAHIDVHLTNGSVRQYSLCGDPAERNRYRIAVQREAAGRGGSAHLQDSVSTGDIVPVSLPRNHFPLAPNARHHVMIAAGIGVTPFLSMVSVAARSGASFELHYCTRTPEETPFRAELAPLSERGLVRFYHSNGLGSGRLDIGALIGAASPDAHVYCCGPERMIEAVKTAASERPADTLHFEHFGPNGMAADPGGEGFDVELARSKRVIRIPAGQTILAGLREAGLEIDASCEGGVCTTCKTRYLAGVPIHRDLVMKAEERREFIMPCVSGCASERLVLDL